MQRVAYYYWIVLDHVNGKLRKTRFRAAEAPAPGAIRLDDTVEWREVPELADKPASQWPLISAPPSSNPTVGASDISPLNRR